MLVLGLVGYAAIGSGIGWLVYEFGNSGTVPTLHSLAVASACGLLWPITIPVALYLVFTTDWSK